MGRDGGEFEEPDVRPLVGMWQKTWASGIRGQDRGGRWHYIRVHGSLRSSGPWEVTTGRRGLHT